MRVFEKDCPGPLGLLVSNAAGSATPRRRYLAINAEWDGRVTPVRQRLLEQAIATGGERTHNLNDLFRYYKRHYVNVPGSSAFSRNLNAQNEIVPGSSSSWQVTDFGTILNLSWNTEAFLHARHSGAEAVSIFHDFPDPAGDAEIEARWFEERFASQGTDAQDRFLGQAFRAIQMYLAGHLSEEPHPAVGTSLKPVWVVEWNRLSSVLDEHPNQWLRFVGCSADKPYRQLLIALRYGPEDGMPALFRPSQLDSGDNNFHFPVPGEAETVIGGLALNLCPTDRYGCSREWIHSAFRFEPRFFRDGGRKWGWAGSDLIDSEALARARQVHHKYMIDKGISQNQDWMQPVV